MPEALYSVPHWPTLSVKAEHLAGIVAHEQACVDTEARKWHRDRQKDPAPIHRALGPARLPQRPQEG